MAEGNPIKYSDLVVDDGAIERLIKAIDTLEKRFLNAQKKFRAEIEKTKKSTEDFTDATEDQDAELEKLEKQLEKLIKANKELQDTDGKLTEQKKKAVKLAKEEEKLRKKLIELTDDQAVANEELKIEIQQQRKVVKDQAKANKGLTGEYDKQSKRLNELRKKYKNLAVAGKENTEEAKKLIIEVTELDEKLKAVDKSVGQTQRSVGNYKDQVKEALAETDLFGASMGFASEQSGAFGTIISQLQVVIGILSKMFNKNTAEVTGNTVAQEVNTTATKKATFVQRVLAGAVNFT
jgi:chromosome segregation ATPase